MTSSDHNRLKWRCRRGLLELDLVLERYLSKHPTDARLLALLDLPDPQLWAIVCGRSDAYPAALEDLVSRLRAA